MHDDLWPTTLLYGGTGTGKFSIAYAAAMELGLNFYGVNAINFVGDSSAYTEAKLKALSEKARCIMPCLIYIRNIHVRILFYGIIIKLGYLLACSIQIQFSFSGTWKG